MKKWIVLMTGALFSLGAHAGLQVLPSSVNFFNVNVGSFGRSETITVRNLSDQDINVSTSDTCFGDFYVVDTCFYLSRYQSCNIRVEFRPRREGYQSCSISIRDTTNGSLSTVFVSGRGVAR
ncbi:MAG: hypothetical protein KDD34_08275 [Bdellovibrionales bacterium]|nr:hypothetical protein [Bdellovibrionales bacterium]